MNEKIEPIFFTANRRSRIRIQLKVWINNTGYKSMYNLEQTKSDFMTNLMVIIVYEPCICINFITLENLPNVYFWLDESPQCFKNSRRVTYCVRLTPRYCRLNNAILF